jgi:hypothetical protein
MAFAARFCASFDFPTVHLVAGCDSRSFDRLLGIAVTQQQGAGNDKAGYSRLRRDFSEWIFTDLGLSNLSEPRAPGGVAALGGTK